MLLDESTALNKERAGKNVAKHVRAGFKMRVVDLPDSRNRDSAR